MPRSEKNSKTPRATIKPSTSSKDAARPQDQTYPSGKHERVPVDSGRPHSPPGYGKSANSKVGFNVDPGTAAADEAAKFPGDGGSSTDKSSKKGK